MRSSYARRKVDLRNTPSWFFNFLRFRVQRQDVFSRSINTDHNHPYEGQGTPSCHPGTLLRSHPAPFIIFLILTCIRTTQPSRVSYWAVLLFTGHQSTRARTPHAQHGPHWSTPAWPIKFDRLFAHSWQRTAIKGYGDTSRQLERLCFSAGFRSTDRCDAEVNRVIDGKHTGSTVLHKHTRLEQRDKLMSATECRSREMIRFS